MQPEVLGISPKSADEEVEPDVLEHGLREREEPQVVEGRVQLPKPALGATAPPRRVSHV